MFSSFKLMGEGYRGHLTPKVYEIFPDGKKVFIKEVSKNIKIDVTQRIFSL